MVKGGKRVKDGESPPCAAERRPQEWGRLYERDGPLRSAEVRGARLLVFLSSNVKSHVFHLFSLKTWQVETM